MARRSAADAVQALLTARRIAEAQVLDAPTLAEGSALLVELGELWDEPVKARLWQRVLDRGWLVDQAATLLAARDVARERAAKRRLFSQSVSKRGGSDTA